MPGKLSTSDFPGPSMCYIHAQEMSERMQKNNLLLYNFHILVYHGHTVTFLSKINFSALKKLGFFFCLLGLFGWSGA